MGTSKPGMEERLTPDFLTDGGHTKSQLVELGITNPLKSAALLSRR